MARRAEATAWPADGATDGGFVPRRRGCVHGVEIDSESVLYDDRSGRLHFLNWSASAVWWSIDGLSSADELAADLTGQFNASRQAVRDDVLGLLAMLGSQQLIEAVRSHSPRPTNV
jgi:Coenzyme PQQ synthesis protein D (PqqD)